jgi:hypothetical protein
LMLNDEVSRRLAQLKAERWWSKLPLISTKWMDINKHNQLL